MLCRHKKFHDYITMTSPVLVNVIDTVNAGLWQVVSFDEMKSSGGVAVHKPIYCPIHVAETIKYFCNTCQVLALYYFITLYCLLDPTIFIIL